MTIRLSAASLTHPEQASNQSLKLLVVLLLLGSGMTVLLAACGTATSARSTNSNEVHLAMTDFVQHSVTIKKGERLMLIGDTLIPYVIANGTWEQGSAKTAREPGTPEVKDVQISGNGQASLGPFSTSGTFHLYCTLHMGMNLTVIVE